MNTLKSSPSLVEIQNAPRTSPSVNDLVWEVRSAESGFSFFEGPRSEAVAYAEENEAFYDAAFGVDIELVATERYLGK